MIIDKPDIGSGLKRSMIGDTCLRPQRWQFKAIVIISILCLVSFCIFRLTAPFDAFVTSHPGMIESEAIRSRANAWTQLFSWLMISRYRQTNSNQGTDTMNDGIEPGYNNNRDDILYGSHYYYNINDDSTRNDNVIDEGDTGDNDAHLDNKLRLWSHRKINKMAVREDDDEDDDNDDEDGDNDDEDDGRRKRYKKRNGNSDVQEIVDVDGLKVRPHEYEVEEENGAGNYKNRQHPKHSPMNSTRHEQSLRGKAPASNSRNSSQEDYYLSYWTEYSEHFRGKYYPESCVRTTNGSRLVQFVIPSEKACTKESACLFYPVKSDLLTTMNIFHDLHQGKKKPDVPPLPRRQMIKRRATCQSISASEIRASCYVPYRKDFTGESVVTWHTRLSLNGTVEPGSFLDMGYRQPAKAEESSRKEPGRRLPTKSSSIIEAPKENDVYSKWTVYADMTPERPFRIVSVFVTPQVRKFFTVIGYFLPRSLSHPDQNCAMMYCVYKNIANGRIIEFIARSGDLSFAYCPKPPPGFGNDPNHISKDADGNLVNKNIIHLSVTYDHLVFSLPFSLRVARPRPQLPRVHMSICSMVRREGQNLREWIEYHSMMGYGRFILYDNNRVEMPTGRNIPVEDIDIYSLKLVDEAKDALEEYNKNLMRTPSSPEGNSSSIDTGIDIEMELLIEQYKDRIVRVKWPYRHGQTEALTDCIHRFGGQTKWMTFIDVDEYMAPSRHFESVKDVLQKKYESIPYIFSTWLIFGPCNKTRLKTSRIISEVCDSVMETLRWVPKPTFQPRLAAGIQGYSPHHIRLFQDVIERRNSVSQTMTEPSIHVYHYRYRAWPEFVRKRLGDTAGRTFQRSAEEVKRMWSLGKKRSVQFPTTTNRVLRFLPILKERITQGMKGGIVPVVKSMDYDRNALITFPPRKLPKPKKELNGKKIKGK